MSIDVEKPWGVPESWSWCKLEDIGRIVSGGTPSTREVSYWGDDVTWFSPADLTGYVSKYIERGAKSLTKAGLRNSSAQIIPAGSVMFSSRAPIGYVAINLTEASTNQGFKSVVPSVGLYNEYIYYYLRIAKKLAEERAAGTTFKEISGSAFSKLPIPIAPHAEQRRIVAKIEELFSELDKGIQSLTTAREQLKAYRQSVLQHAFEGRLTKDWRGKHPEYLTSPTELEARLKTDGAVNAKRVPGQKLEASAILPAGWAYFRVASLCSVVRGGSPRPAGDQKYYNGHIPFLKVADLTRTTGMYLSTHTSTIKEAGLAKTRMTPPDTLLISNSGATLGVPKICMFETTFNDGVAAFLGIPQGYLEYFYFFWESKTVQLRSIDQGAAQPNLNTSILGETLIPICSKDEARTLVGLLKELLSNIERQSQEIDRNISQAASLRQSILKRAFSGQLVPQDPSDEPASALLARIRAERAKGTPKKPPKPKKAKPEAA